VALVEAYCKEQGLFRTDDAAEPQFTKVLSLDLGDVEPSLAGPKRPQDRVPLSKMKPAFQRALQAPIAERGFALDSAALARTAEVRNNGDVAEIGHGAVVIAAITSCTNTSNPSVMLAAGLLAKKAVEKGLTVKPYVKTSLAPGSRVVTEYYRKAGVTDALDKLGFNVVGYGCTTCIGNSGPLPEEVGAAVKEGDLVAAAVLSGNRNFEGRINPLTRANYLASPPLVVAYALAGTVDIDLATEPLGHDDAGKPVFLKDIWPTQEEVKTLVRDSVLAEMFLKEYGHVFDGNVRWNAIKISGGELYDWNDASTYIQNPPFLADLTVDIKPVPPIAGARVLLALGDSVTTDHISPAGAISKDSPAGKFLQANGVAPLNFNSYGSRRGNDRVMVRGTFANIRIRNAIGQGKEGGWTTHFPDGELMSVYDAATKYIEEGTPLVILAGTEYGTGSSRDWAAKGTFQLGVRAVIAASYERIHRSNLVMMGVLPLQFEHGQTWESLGLTGSEVFDIPVADDLKPGSKVTVTATNDKGAAKTFETIARIDTLVELDYYRNGGILQTVLRKLLKS
jgi:aconitate hydratase